MKKTYFNKDDLLNFLRFIAEEDAQISTIINFFSNNLNYNVDDIKNIVNYGIRKNIFKVVKNDHNFKEVIELDTEDLIEVEWSTSNSIHEIYYNDFDYYRGILLISNT
ncbi:hypothetical protein [Paenibacillus wynnii]|uniref:Uncharacterized protein n=1 Tax=Paenibacillus wynnii TaxID=268407 RepID=A0A098M7A4_9BACL|nr:hypothetical protein [Paenibacillus wynnii]KGE18410.1 hypothetical protein PWYN_28315 [Paenibacillus wynnii]